MALRRAVRRATNALVMWGLRLGLPVPPYTRRNAAIIETVGRKSGRRRRNPVGCLAADRKIVVVAEHGDRADWVRNALEREGRLRVCYRGRWHDGRLRLLDGDPEEYLRRMSSVHAAAVRRLATVPRAIEITFE